MCPLSLACVMKFFVTSCYLTQTYVVVNYVCLIFYLWNCVSKLFVSIHYSLQTYLIIFYVFTIVYLCVEAFCYILLFNSFFSFHGSCFNYFICEKKINAWKIFHKLLTTSINKSSMQLSSLSCFIVSLFVLHLSFFVHS